MSNSFFVASLRPSKFPRGGAFVAACVGLSLAVGSLSAGTMPQNLGNGLDDLIRGYRKVKAAQAVNILANPHHGYGTKKAANIASNIMKDDADRVMVRVQPNGIVPIALLQTRAVVAAPSLAIKATDYTYHGVGVFEAYVSLDDAPALAGLEGVSSVSLSLKPVHAGLHRLTTPGQPNATVGETLSPIGTVYDFGVTQHRVDQINKTYNSKAVLDYEGKGVSVGIMSDSFAGSTTTPSAATDMASGDLPGGTNAAGNTQPVVVLADFTGGTDEGRGMSQTVFKMAPKARLAFATADDGEVSFANNIRALAALPGFAYDASIQQGFKADVIVDDVSYLDEPFFQDGVIAQGVNDVVKAGVSYFSSAANNPPTNGYDADFNFVSEASAVTTTGTGATASTTLNGTNINLTSVPAGLYAGGFQNFDPTGATTTLAQTVNYPNAVTLELYGLSTLTTILQWNDPVDTVTPTVSQTPLYVDTGTVTYNSLLMTQSTTYGTTMTTTAPSHMFTEGQEYYLVLTPATTPTTSGDSPLDGQVTIKDASGNTVSFTDNNGAGAPEYVIFFPPATGEYTLSVTAFEEVSAGDMTDGSFTLDTYTASGTPGVTQDLNLLVFDSTGAYQSADSAVTNNIASNSPLEIASFAAPATGPSQVQFVIARSNQQPTSGRAANHLRYLCFGDGITPLGPTQFFSYTTPLTFGHSSAAGANSVAAYPYYRPSIPEFFTSPGPATIYFDASGNPLSTPEVRLKPDIAAMDGANTSFFGEDDNQDEDSALNFFGTSDAAPHAAAVAALVLEANGGPGKVTPAQMKSVLQSSAFVHDLDPYYATGSARTSEGGDVIVTVNSDPESDTVIGSLVGLVGGLAGAPATKGTAGTQDPNSISVQYVGPGSLATLVFNPTGSAATAGNPTDGTNGLDTTGTYFETSTPGVVFDEMTPFTLGTSSSTLTSGVLGSVTSTPSNFVTSLTTPSNGASNLEYFTLSLSFTSGSFPGGAVLRFTVGRDEYQSADVTTSGGTSFANGSADILGGGVSLPDGVETKAGMTFSGTTTSGKTFSGQIRNKIGSGYSVVDGFGFINAEAAVTTPLP